MVITDKDEDISFSNIRYRKYILKMISYMEKLNKKIGHKFSNHKLTCDNINI